jgi:hypothetical protein
MHEENFRTPLCGTSFSQYLYTMGSGFFVKIFLDKNLLFTVR